MKFPLSSKYLLALLIVIALAIVITATRYSLYVTTPSGSGENVQIFDFGQGQSLKKIAAALEEKKIIKSAGMFVLYARLHGDATRLQAGLYRFSDAMPPAEILGRMVSGDIYVERFTVPEGYSIYQIAELIAGRRLFDKNAFLRECFSRPLLRELGIDGKSVEGYLYPSTYDIKPGISPAGLIRLMVANFEKIYGRDFAVRAEETRLTKREILILASMIEKEAVRPEERPVIASVFRNRILKGMPLQSDPTAVYGVRAFAGNVSRNDITRDTPYNTYLISGLPPGPIGNPGRDAIDAAINPAKTGFLYFVAKKDGTHHFSRTLEEHNRAILRYLKN